MQNVVRPLVERTGPSVEVNVKYGSYRVKGQIGCQNNHINEETLEKAVVMAVELLSENVELMHGSGIRFWKKIVH